MSEKCFAARRDIIAYQFYSIPHAWARRRDRVPRMRPLLPRLMKEAELSIAVAETLDPEVLQAIVLHVDANRGREHRSGAYSKMLAGMAMGYGFQVKLKPEAWCATNVADHVVRGKAARDKRAEVA